MKVYNFVTPALVLETLNRRQPSADAFGQMTQRYLELKGKISRPERRSLHEAEVSRCLGNRIEDWLITGMNPDGSESPRNRDLFRTRRAKLAVLAYLEKYPPSVTLFPGSPDLTLIVGEIREGSTAWNDFFATMAGEADRLFTAAMVSDWRESLCKCRHAPCGDYFLLKKPRRSYRHGTFCCRQHQRLASAAAATKDRRSRAQQKLVELAAKQLVKWRAPRWRDDKSLKCRLAAALSESIGRNPNLRANKQMIQANWVTRNSLKIEQKRLELANSAKSTVT